VYNDAGDGGVGGSSGVSMISAIRLRSAKVVGRCSNSAYAVRCSVRVSPTIVCTSCGSASTGTCPLLIRRVN